VIDHIVYDSFGNITTQTNASNADRFLFAGMQYDATTGLYYDHARYYDAAIGRFVSEDPTGFEAGDTNLYRYVGDNPINHVDPSGTQDFGGGGSGTTSQQNYFQPTPPMDPVPVDEIANALKGVIICRNPTVTLWDVMRPHVDYSFPPGSYYPVLPNPPMKDQRQYDDGKFYAHDDQYNWKVWDPWNTPTDGIWQWTPVNGPPKPKTTTPAPNFPF
jgi:RHS repeat-associated protein